MLVVIASYLFTSIADTQKHPKGNGQLPEDRSTSTSIQANSPSTSVYFWTKITELDNAQINEVINTCKANSIDTIYLEIDEYITIKEKDRSATAERSLDRFNTNLDNFLRRAKSENIKVEGLAGGTNWTDSSHIYIPQDLLAFVISYNEDHPEAGFSGLQLDIEFYTRQDFHDHRNKYYLDYISMVEKLIKIKNDADADHFRLGFAVPYWADENDDKGLTKINGIKKPFTFHLIDTLTESQNSYLAVMSYKNYLGGSGGIIDISEGEINYASSRAAETVGIIVALKTNLTSEDRVKNNKTSFYGSSKEKFTSAVDDVSSEFKDRSAFEGVAIHHLQGYQKLE